MLTNVISIPCWLTCMTGYVNHCRYWRGTSARGRWAIALFLLINWLLFDMSLSNRSACWRGRGGLMGRDGRSVQREWSSGFHSRTILGKQWVRTSCSWRGTASMTFDMLALRLSQNGRLSGVILWNDMQWRRLGTRQVLWGQGSKRF